jgi:hypothetical protein
MTAKTKLAYVSPPTERERMVDSNLVQPGPPDSAEN